MTLYSLPFSDNHRSINGPILRVLLFVGLGSMTYGYSASIISTTLGQPTFITYFDLDTRPNATNLIAATNGIFQAGGFLGTLALPFFSDRWGRKCGMLVSATLVIVGGAMLAGSTNIVEFLVFRFVSGCGTFMILSSVPTWMSEIVPPHLRGALVNLNAIFFVGGYCTQAWVGLGVFFWHNSESWRLPLALQCLWPILLVAGLYWVPESPRFLLMRGRYAEAESTLIRLHRHSSDPLHEAARTELSQIRQQVEIDQQQDSSWMHIFRTPSLRKRLPLTIGTTGFAQCSGVLVITNYGPSLYAQLGFSQTKQLLYPAAWLTLAVGLTSAASLVVDRFPRNKLLAVGIFGCESMLATEAALVASFRNTSNRSGLEAAVAALFLFLIPFDLCVDGLQFTYVSEMWSNHLRAKGLSVGVAVISLTNIVWLQAAPTAFKTIGWNYYLVFIVTGTLGAVVVWFFFPDTKGKPLEEAAAFGGEETSNAIPTHGSRSQEDSSHSLADCKASSPLRYNAQLLEAAHHVEHA